MEHSLLITYLKEQVATLTDRVAYLEEEAAFYKSEVGLNLEVAQTKSLQIAFKWARGPARMALALFNAHNHTLSVVQLDEAIPGTQCTGRKEIYEGGRNIFQVYAVALRASLGKENLITNWGSGYTLSPLAVTLIAEHLPHPLLPFAPAHLSGHASHNTVMPLEAAA